jgi:hypothetical protein
VTTTRIIAVGAPILVVAGLVAGFLTIGPPGHTRRVALDKQRVDDLKMIALSLNGHYGSAAGATVPANLRGLSLPVRPDGSSRLADPVDGKPYDYSRLDARHYRLCASFELPSDRLDEAGRWDNTGKWRHRAGKNCYTLDVSNQDP